MHDDGEVRVGAGGGITSSTKCSEEKDSRVN